MGGNGTPSVNQTCLADAGQLHTAVHRDLTAKDFDGLLATQASGRYQVEYLEFERPDRALQRTSIDGRPTEIDIAGNRFIPTPGKASTYIESPISDRSASLAALPSWSVGLFSSGTPSRDGPNTFIVHAKAFLEFSRT